MKLEKQLEILINSRFSIINLITREEERIIKLIKNITAGERALITWDLADSSHIIKQSEPPAEFDRPRNPLEILELIERHKKTATFVLKDFHLQMKNDNAGNVHARKLRNLAFSLKKQQTAKTVIIITPVMSIPEELKDEVYIMDMPLPEVDELEREFEEFTSGIKNRVKMGPGPRQKFLESALGLTCSQFQRVLALILMTNREFNERSIDLLLSEKKQIIRESGALEFFPTIETEKSIGGLENLKTWLRSREIGFSREAREYGLPYPKGLALIGIPGTGKSLTAKVIARIWKMPLLRMDMGAIFGSLVGQSEENIRCAIKLAETVSPCILWIDEVEKGFSGTGGSGDGGTASRVFGHFLSWMQEKEKPVYVVATANNVEHLPIEFLRKGRFDEIFFIDVPTKRERKEIFRVHIQKRREFARGYDLDMLAENSRNFVGAEIEQAVIEGMYRGINEKREFANDDILAALSEMRPLFESQKDQTQRIKKWAEEVNARLASEPEDDGNRFHPSAEEGEIARKSYSGPRKLEI